jgi:hypothetical protein
MLRFCKKVNKNGPVPKHNTKLGACWVWTGSLSKKGYGRFALGRINKHAHRVSWWLSTGRWPTPCALHKCDNRACVRYSHLEEGDNKKNQKDCVARGRRPSTKGQSNPNAKLTERDILTIRSSGKKAKELAKKYKVSSCQIWRIVTNRNWVCA